MEDKEGAEIALCTTCGRDHAYYGATPSLKECLDAVNEDVVFLNRYSSKVEAIKAWRTIHAREVKHDGYLLRLAAEHAEMKELLEQLLGIPVDVLNRPGNLDFILEQARSLLARLNKKEE